MIISRFILVTTILYLFVSCNKKEQNKLSHNPYKDNYSDIATLKHRDKWNGANVHDPSCIKIEDTYYLYSTDAYYIPPNINFKDDSLVEMGNIPVRSSKDLVHWKFEGWVFDSIPQDAFNHVTAANEGKMPNGIWAPYIHNVNGQLRLYYSVSYFGSNGSYIGMATSDSPLGPWTNQGVVVKTALSDKMNAIDPTVVRDNKSGNEWMIYGSYFGGLYALELDPQTGKALHEGDLGNCIARRAKGKDKIIEAPEIVYNEDQDMYYLFVSYDPLFTFYNLRVGRSKTPNGPFKDYFGNDMKDTTNNYPILTHSYMFQNHPGWSGNAHCNILKDGRKYYLLHQGRLAPDNLMMQLQCREIHWLSNGWPALSPERYNPVSGNDIKKEELVGTWEVVELKEIPEPVELWQGQIPAGGWKYSPDVFNVSQLIEFKSDNKVLDKGEYGFTKYLYNEDSFVYLSEKEELIECALFRGWDWENEKETILFSGILENGHGLWGKKVE